MKSEEVGDGNWRMAINLLLLRNREEPRTAAKNGKYAL
jgi:hypothetical protein